MSRKSSNIKSKWVLLLVLLCGVVLGGFIGQLTKGVSYLSWLNYGQTFGIIKPIVLDLGILMLTFGFSIKFTISSIIGLIIAIIVYRFI